MAEIVTGVVTRSHQEVDTLKSWATHGVFSTQSVQLSLGELAILVVMLGAKQNF